MQLIDTHCHLDFHDFDTDRADVIKRAVGSGLIRMIVPGTDLESSKKAVELAAMYPEIFAAVGIHPHEADMAKPESFSALRDMLVAKEKIVAVGEIGLDHYRNYSSPENQKTVFIKLLDLAKEMDLPVILHNRNADQDFIQVVKSFASFNIKGVVHCFSGGVDLLDKVLLSGLHVSFAGNITFERSEKVKSIIKKVPMERLLLETDSPYITPHPHRGERNEPSYVKHLLDVYAEIYGVSPEDIARVTTHNANQLFKLGLPEKAVISYPIRNSLYLNITNRCTNSCTFCARRYSEFVMGHNLKLDGEPGAEEIIKSLGDISNYKEIVFCGYGEPTLRLETVKKVAGYIKEKGGKVRLTTNGQANLIAMRDVTPELKGLIDKVAVSINASTASEYNRLCRSTFGENAYKAIGEFVSGAKRAGIDVQITCIDIIGEDGVAACKKIADTTGAEFRVRKLDVVG